VLSPARARLSATCETPADVRLERGASDGLICRSIPAYASCMARLVGALDEDDGVFKALADKTRRAVLDALRTRAGQTLGELCELFDMTRQSTSQHVNVLEQANLIATVRRGREKLHYLNPVPIHDLQSRWIHRFETPRLDAISAIKQKAEQAMPQADTDRPTFLYVTYIESTPQLVWQALTDPDMTATYWGHSNVSDWQVGSRWEHQRTDGSGIADCFGTVIESEPPKRLVTTWEDPTAKTPIEPSRVTFTIKQHGAIVRLTVTHQNLPDEANRDLAAQGWAAVLSNLKSLLETGHVLPETPWLMP
jgi:uncharacterized protein YndB with AHSA1/START domain/DNA-binding transcriptional ArsR family regulator